MVRIKHKKGNQKVFHLYDDNDTLCKMSHTGKFRIKDYVALNDDEILEMQIRCCRMCESKYNASFSPMVDTLVEIRRNNKRRSNQKETVKESFVEITNDFINQGMSDNGGWGRFQVSLLGLDWPLDHDWRKTVVGKLISEKTAKLFLSRKNAHIKKAEIQHTIVCPHCNETIQI